MRRLDKRVISVFLSFVLCISSLTVTAFAAEPDPYSDYIKIYTIEDLRAIDNDLTAKYILMNDIDMWEETRVGGKWNYDGWGWKPIGYDRNKKMWFTGELNGNGHSIIGMYQEGFQISYFEGSTKYTDKIGGLFCCLDGYVHNLRMKDSCIFTQPNGLDGEINQIAIGAISAYSTNDALLKYVSSEEGVIENYQNVPTQIAGLAYNASAICCFNSSDIALETDSMYSATDNIFGIARTAINCYNSGNLKRRSSRRQYKIYPVSEVSTNCYNVGKFTNCSYDESTSNTVDTYILEDSIGVLNLDNTLIYSDDEMRDQSSYKNWDFENTWILDPDSGYPYPQLRNLRQLIKKTTKQKRLGGANRYDTASLIAQEAFPGGADEMILVTGSKFPDALAASGYAGAKNCPLLITSLKALKPEIQSLLTDTWNRRVKNVTIIGGGFDPAVSAALRACGVETIKTIAGADRYETAEKIFLAGLEEGIFNYNACVVATGSTAADALSVSPWTYKYHMPIFLAKKGNKSLTLSEQEIVKNFNKVYIVGSEGVVNDPVVASMGSKVERLAGNNRYETSVKIAERFAEPGDMNTLTFASGKDNSFPDALCGAMLAGKRSGPVLLVSGNESSNTVVYKYVSNKYGKTTSNELYFFGAANALSDNSKDKILSLF